MKRINHCTAPSSRRRGGGLWQDRTTNTAEERLWLNVASCTPKCLFHQHGMGWKHIDQIFMLPKTTREDVQHTLWPEQQYMCPLLIYQDSFFTLESLSMKISHLLQFVCIHKCESYIPVGFVLALSLCLSVSLKVFLCCCCPPPSFSLWLCLAFS